MTQAVLDTTRPRMVGEGISNLSAMFWGPPKSLDQWKTGGGKHLMDNAVWERYVMEKDGSCVANWAFMNHLKWLLMRGHQISAKFMVARSKGWERNRACSHRFSINFHATFDWHPISTRRRPQNEPFERKVPCFHWVKQATILRPRYNNVRTSQCQLSNFQSEEKTWGSLSSLDPRIVVWVLFYPRAAIMKEYAHEFHFCPHLSA